MVLVFALGGVLTNKCEDVVGAVTERAKEQGATVPQRLLVSTAMKESLTGFFIFALAFNLDVSVNFIWALVR